MNNIYCINLPERKDRREKCEKQFRELGLEVEFFEGIRDETPYIGFNKAMKGVITKAYEDGCDHALILEDDVILRNWAMLECITSELPKEYDLLYLGGNVTNDRCYNHSKHLWRALDIWTSHAILYSRKMLCNIVKKFPIDGQIYDEYLRTQVQPFYLCYISKPFLAVQDVSWSDIWQCQADYTSTFRDSEAKLK